MVEDISTTPAQCVKADGLNIRELCKNWALSKLTVCKQATENFQSRRKAVTYPHTFSIALHLTWKKAPTVGAYEWRSIKKLWGFPLSPLSWLLLDSGWGEGSSCGYGEDWTETEEGAESVWMDLRRHFNRRVRAHYDLIIFYRIGEL